MKFNMIQIKNYTSIFESPNSHFSLTILVRCQRSNDYTKKIGPVNEMAKKELKAVNLKKTLHRRLYIVQTELSLTENAGDLYFHMRF